MGTAMVSTTTWGTGTVRTLAPVFGGTRFKAETGRCSASYARHMLDEVVADEQRRVLMFVNACNLGGYQPSEEEVEAWLGQPRAEKSTPMLAGTALAQMMRAHEASWRAAFGTEVGGQSVTGHLLGLSWLTGSKHRLQLSHLGRSLLRTLELDEASNELVVLSLDSTDVLAYPRLMGHLRELGPGLVVDPYLGVDELQDLVEYTEVDRILVSAVRGSERARVAVAVVVNSELLGRTVEVRVTEDKALHDRSIVTEGAVHVIGSSLNSVSRRTASTGLVELPAAAAGAHRAQVEEWWSAAVPLRVESGGQ